MRLTAATLIAASFAAVLIGTAQAEILIKIDKSTQRMTVVQGGEPLYNWVVSTGRTGHATPSGSFTAFRMEAEHYSKEWDDAPMPHSIFFTMKGHAIHGTYDTAHLGTAVSHGCVRLSDANAAQLYELVQQQGFGAIKVSLMGEAPGRAQAVARRGAPRDVQMVGQ